MTAVLYFVFSGWKQTKLRLLWLGADGVVIVTGCHDISNVAMRVHEGTCLRYIANIIAFENVNFCSRFQMLGLVLPEPDLLYSKAL